jgi:uncharacterized membrane protein
MEFNDNLFSPGVWWLSLTIMALLLLLAIRAARWRQLIDSKRANSWFAAIVGLMVLWLLRTEAIPDVTFHLLGVTSLTLMFGWALGLLGVALALLGVCLAGVANWGGYPFSLITLGVIPVSISYLSLLTIRHFLPRHFFVYVFLNAFITGGLAGMLAGYSAAGLLVLSGHYSYAALDDSLMPFFPIMFFPEAVLNGWIMTLLVVFRPEWVYSFRDDDYLRGK